METSTLLVDRMDISLWLLQLACLRIHRHQEASSKVVVVGSIVRHATHAIRYRHRKHFTTVGELHGVRHPHTRSRIGCPRLARAAGVLVASRSHAAGDQSSLPDVYGKNMGVAPFRMDSLDAHFGVHELDSFLLHRVENEARKVASVGAAVLYCVRGSRGGRDVWNGKLREPGMGRCHRANGSG